MADFERMVRVVFGLEGLGVRATSIMKPQLKEYLKLELIKDQYPTSAVRILRDQAEEMPVYWTQP